VRALTAAALLAGMLLAAGPLFGQTSENVSLRGGLLTVELKDAVLGRVIARIAAEGGFKADVGGAAYSKTVSTEFRGVELEKGLRRILELAGQKSFSIQYAADGSIKELDVYEAAAPAGASRPSASRPPSAVPRPAYRSTPYGKPPAPPQPQMRTAPTPVFKGEAPAAEPPPFEEPGQQHEEPPPFEEPGQQHEEPPPFEPGNPPGGGN